MSANYLHGVETIETTIGARPVSVVKSAVIALIGYAPEGPNQELTLVQTPQDAAQFGKTLPGYDIPMALRAIQAQGAGTVIVVNVKSSNNMRLVEAEAHTLVNGVTTLNNYPDVDKMDSFSVLYDGDVMVAGEDYNVSLNKITRIATGQIPADGEITVDYITIDTETFGLSDIEGDFVDGVRTGSRLLEECFQKFGFTARLFIAPSLSGISTTVDQLLVQLADKYRGHALVEGTPNVTVADAIANRGLIITGFGTSSKRAYLCYPRMKVLNPVTNEDELHPYSSFMAGVIANTDNTDGYWFSPSNRQIKGITGVERTITSAVNDASTEANLLNEAGITTVFNSFGTGLRTWGNRCASYPTNTEPTNFIAVQRTADILHESVERASLQFLDKPITNALIDSVRDTVNEFIGKLIQRGALIDGECTYIAANNSPVEIAAGHVTFNISFMPPTPAERITFESFIDINLLAGLGSAN